MCPKGANQISLQAASVKFSQVFSSQDPILRFRRDSIKHAQ